MIVYLDLLALFNFAVNGAVLAVAGRAAGFPLQTSRVAAAAAVGSGIFVISFLARQYIYIEWACRITGGLAMAWMAFRPPTAASLVRATVVVFVSAQLLGGVVFSLALMRTGALGQSWENLPAAAVLGAAGIGVLLALFYLDRRDRGNRLRQSSGRAVIYYKGKLARVRALIDTGNVLQHPVSGWPVVILRRDVFRSLFGSQLADWAENFHQAPAGDWAERIALIPYRGVGGGGLLPAVHPDRVVLECDNSRFALSAVFVAMGPKNQELPAIAFAAPNQEEGDSVEDVVG